MPRKVSKARKNWPTIIDFDVAELAGESISRAAATAAAASGVSSTSGWAETKVSTASTHDFTLTNS